MLDLMKLNIAEREIKQHFPIPVMYSDILGLYGDINSGSVCCPFHGERTPSFSYSPNIGDGIWKCFGECSRGGDTIELFRFYIEKKQNRKISRSTAIKQLVSLPNIAIRLSVKNVEADALEFESFEELLSFEYQQKIEKLNNNQLLINRMLNDLTKEENKEIFIEKYDKLLKVNWKNENDR